MSSINLERTCDATADSGYSKKWTFSAWVKRGLIGTEQGLFGNKRTDNNTNSRFRLRIKDTNRLCWEIKDSGGSDDSSFETNMLFLDTNAWYHIVFIYDSDNSTESDRMKCYVNGKDVRTELGGFSSVNEVGSGFGSLWSSSVKNYLGVTHDNSGNPYRWDGLMSHVHFTYGYRYEASAFGSTDSTTGEWKIKTSPSVTYGSQGFWLFKNSASVTDQSGEGNDYTLNSGTLTFTHDNPSNNFATFNSQVFAGGGTTTFSNGNNTGQSPTSQGLAGVSSFGASSGKFYAEFKQSAESISGEGAIGVVDTHYINSTFGLSSSGYLEYCVGTWGFRNNSGLLFYSSGGTRYTATGQHANWSNGDIFMLALDADNGRLYIGKNGQWNASNTWSSSTPSQYITLDSTGFEGTYHFAVGDSSSGNHVTWQANFGNGYFGTTAITTNSGNGYAGAEGKSKFNYEVPSGYSALSTEGLNQ